MIKPMAIGQRNTMGSLLKWATFGFFATGIFLAVKLSITERDLVISELTEDALQMSEQIHDMERLLAQQNAAVEGIRVTASLAHERAYEAEAELAEFRATSAERLLAIQPPPADTDCTEALSWLINAAHSLH